MNIDLSDNIITTECQTQAHRAEHLNLGLD